MVFDMKVKLLAALAVTGLMVAGVTSTLAANPPKMKMTTEIPASITAPAKAETSIGTLEYFDGVPSGKTVETVYDYLDRSRAVNVFMNSIPMLSMYSLREGQAAIESVIDAKGQAKGGALQGKILYNAHCSSCHGEDGKAMDFKSNKEGIQGIGWLAKENPQESIHKIRWGHPGSKMPSMLVDKALSEQDATDILTYSQFLQNLEDQ